MQASMFNVCVPLDTVGDRDDVFLMNTFTDAQLIVSRDVAALLDRVGSAAPDMLTQDERDALSTLTDEGFIVPDRESERRHIEQYFRDVREGTDQLRVTVLTTLQCNFACDYCFQGDHGDYNKFAAKMTMETAARVAAWTEERLDTLKPESFVFTLFGGEPLLNLPVAYYLTERLWAASQARGIRMLVNVITNGLLLTPEVVDRLAPYGLNAVKITLDGDHDTHNRMRPLRGGQGTFDRIIHNVRQVAGKCRISIGGNFDETSVDSYPALLDFLKSQDFADSISKVAFKPVIKPPQPQRPKGFIPLTPISGDKPLGGTCMTAAGGGVSQPHGSSGTSACDSCHFVDEKMSFLREETQRRGFSTVDGVHMGPCELHRKHAYTIGPDGALYACPGFSGEATMSVGHIDGGVDARQARTAARFDQHQPWKACGDCSYIPVCGGGCSVASHAELGDLHQPNCHKSSFEAGVISLAQQAAQTARAASAA